MFGSKNLKENVREKKYKEKKWRKIKNKILKVDKLLFFVTSNSFYLFNSSI